MIDVVRATAELGLAASGDRAAALRAREHARGLYRRGRTSFYGRPRCACGAKPSSCSAMRIARAGSSPTRKTAATARGGRVDQLAISALAGAAIAPGPLAAAVTWFTGGLVKE